MASQVILKKSSVAARVPVAGDLAYGELALNYADGLLYFKKSDGTTIGIIGNATGTNTGDETTATIKTKLGITTLSGSNTGDQVLPTLSSLSGQPLDADLTAIAALAGTSGLLKKTAANTWSLDTTAYTTNLGTVTGVTATAPVVSSGGTTPVISMAAATTSASGYLTSTDWNTFNGKQAAGTYATGTGSASGTNTGDETTATIKTKLGITTLSGSNTGDETTATIKTKLGITTLSGSNTGDQTIPTTLPNANAITFTSSGGAAAGSTYTGAAVLTVDYATVGAAAAGHTHSYQAADADLLAIGGLTGTTGLLKKTAADTWTLDTTAYLTSYTESDTLATVTARGASTSTAVTLSNAGNRYSGHFYYDPYDAAGNHYPHFTDGSSASGTKINWRLFTGATNSVVHTWTTSLATFGTNIAATNFSGSSSGTNTGDNPGVTSVAGVTPIVSSGGTTPSISHATSGATAGTYNNVTVNTFGHVTAGSNVGYVTSSGVTSVATSGGYGGLTLTGGTITTTGTITMGGTPTGTWPISVSGSSTSTPLVSIDNSIAYGRSGLQFIQISSAAGDVATTTNAPTADWWHIIRANHGNASGYYTDLALPMTSAGNIRYRRIAAGASSGWITVWDSTNLTNLNQLTNGPGYGTGTVTAVTATTPIVSSGGTTPNITHAASGATAGTYNNVTVNTFGHVTAGSNVAYYHSGNIPPYPAEADTLATVTARGSSTTVSIGTGSVTATVSSAALNFAYNAINVDFTNAGGSATAIAFGVGGLSNRKGAIAYERKSGWGLGDFHFLQNTVADSSSPTLAMSVMTIKSTGSVGIGTTSPQAKLQVLDLLKISNAAQSQGALALGDGSSTLFNVGIARWNGSTNAAGTGGMGYFAQGPTNSGGHYFYTGDASAGSTTLRATIDTAGNLGLGVTPSAIYSTRKAMQLGLGAIIDGDSGAGSWFEAGANFYFNTSASLVYKNTDVATRYLQYNGAHQWFNAPSGTAGAAITFTQAMTLDASGRLIVPGSTALNLVTAGNQGTLLGGFNDATTGWSLAKAVIALKPDDTTYSTIGMAPTNGLLYFARTNASGVGTLTSWLEVSSAGIANFKLARPQWNGTNLVIASDVVSSIAATSPIVRSAATGAITLSHAASGVTAGTYNNVTVNTFGHVTAGSNVAYLTGYTETDTLATVTGRGATTNTRVTLAGGITSNGTSTRDKISVWDSTGIYVIGMQSGITFGAINNDYAMTFQMNNADARGFWWGDASHTTAQGAMSLSTNGKLSVAHSIRVGFGESDNTVPGAAYALQVNGSFAATTKSFVIDHPTKPGMQLRYGSLEGPENGVYIRGRLKGNKIELPEYWTKLVDPDSITVNLTPIGKSQDIYVEDIIDNVVYVGGENVNCFYTVFAERVDVEKLEVEIA